MPRRHTPRASGLVLAGDGQPRHCANGRCGGLVGLHLQLDVDNNRRTAGAFSLKLEKLTQELPQTET